MTLEPRFWNSFCTSWPAPCPIDTIVVTAAMPMTTPRTVSPERSLFLASVRKDRTSKSKRSMGSLRSGGTFGPGENGLAVAEVAAHNLGKLVLDQPKGHGDGAQELPVLDPDDAVL